MSKVNFKSSRGIIEELESAVEEVKLDPDAVKTVQTRISGCKHAVQIFALSLEYSRLRGISPVKLKTMEIE